MKQFWLNTQIGLRYYKMAIAKCGLQASDAFIAALITATVSVKWESLSFWEKCMIIAGCWLVTSKVIQAFLDTTMKEFKKESGQPIEDTTIITK